jgi:hypothetical protein
MISSKQTNTDINPRKKTLLVNLAFLRELVRQFCCLKVLNCFPYTKQEPLATYLMKIAHLLVSDFKQF